uniref:Dystonin n=1 Tax=Calidris pygmaea TaxID=425635 RepID=A0A8C3K7A7_9CHAR
MSSSADFSDEEDFSQRSGTVSPAPGDTLPWNLSKHERSKRKIQGGPVLDPADRAVVRIADERDKVQKKTFTKWINQHLVKVRKHVKDLYEDLRDGHNLISLLEVLSGDTLPREKGRMRFHRLQNVQIALEYLKKRQVKLVNIRNDDITDGNPKLTLGLIWTIILHFQISDIHVTGESEDMSAKERLLLWSQQTTEGYAGIRCENFTTCWRDGRLFNAIIHKYRPDLIDMNTVAVQSNLANLEHAFFVAEKLGVARLLDPEDVDVPTPDEKSVITYVSSLYDAFPKVPEGGEGISANDVEVKWVEYQNMVNYLRQWIRYHVTMMSDRTFSNNPVELKACYNHYLQFKETEIPPAEADKSKIKHLYKLLEVWIEFGRIKLPQGYHPNDIEKEWGKLIVAMLEREKTLRLEMERLEMLAQIANRIQRDSQSCEDKLILARNALQSDTKRLESGLQFQHEAELAGYLLESENLLRQQVIDAQILIDGKYYQADQLVQRVAKLRDELIAIRNEYSSMYNKGHALTTEQTKLMISGLTESLNSGFTTNLTPELNAAMTQGLTPTLTSSSLTSEEEVNMKFVQDLLSWVEEMQVQLDRTEWGSDLPSVESHLENHKNVHKAIEEFESSLKEAKMSEMQMTAALKLSYTEKLHKLESQYSKLLNTSRNQERHLDTLHNFVSRATRELIWLNEKEEEEVAYDWSERNTNITRKKEYHAELMRELDQKEVVIKSVQEIAEQLLLENHPARLTIEAYRAAMQTQWSWILQLCHCVEQHLRENAAYFEFFSDAKEAMEYLKNLKDTIYRKYSCDRSTSLHRLEELVQESMEEKEQLLHYKSTVAGLVGRAKAIIQLKPRNPDCILKTSIPIKAICDYRQIEITIYKDDECVLANNSHRAKWKVISPSGNEAMVPSVCFTVPPPNKEAIDTANRIEQQFQNVLALWHESHLNMKSVVSWHYLTNEIEAVRTMLPGEHQQVLSNLQSRFDDFVEDSQKSKIFTSSDTAQLEREVNVCKQYYQELLKSAEREEHEESLYNLYISEVRNIRLHLESCQERLIRQIRTPMERDDPEESLPRISEQEKLKEELDRLKDDLGVITDKCEEFFSQAAGSPSVPTLRSELNVVIQNMNQVYSMSSIYIDKLKTVNLVLKNTQDAEALVKRYETKLCEEEAVTADKNNIENLMGTLKVRQWRSEVDEKRQVFHALEDELQKAKMISDQMFKMHKERDLDFDWHKEKVDQLAERWQNIHSQIENRLRDLEGINKSLKYYKDTYNSLDTWIQQVEDTQQKIQEIHPENSKALAKQLNQHKMLVSEIEMKQSKIDECQKYAEQYSAAVKDYELQTMTYRAMVDSQQKSPVKRRRMQSSSDFIIQEFMDLRTHYTALVTLMSQYIKFAGDSLKRLEEEEVGLPLAANQVKRTARQTESNIPKIKMNYQEELKSVQQEKTQLRREVEELTRSQTKAEITIRHLNSQISSLQKEKLAAEHRTQSCKGEANNLQDQYKKIQEQLLQKTKVEKENHREIQMLKNELAKSNQMSGTLKREIEDLNKWNTETKLLMKQIQMSAQTLAEIVKNTESFLKENGEKLSQEDKTILEQKLNEAKTKCLLLSQKAEESKKELDKAMTTAIKQETEKVAAIEQLEESKNTIENLLDWLSNVDKEAEHGRQFEQVIEQNGTHFEEGDGKCLEGEEDDVNGNLLEIQQGIGTEAQHEKIISQQQAVIIATQSAQALLEKQGHYLSPEEKDKMQRNMKELKAQYETALAESERKMKLTHSLREELEKFDADYSEFETWLQQAEQELDNLEAGASDFSGIMVKLKRQKSFSEDVISHKGDLRYITISGQRVLDAARSCSKRDGVKVDKDGIDTSATYAEVQNKLDVASNRFKSLYTKVTVLKSITHNCGIFQVLQGQVSNHQIAVEKLKKAAEVLLDTRGELTPDKDEIQKTLGKMFTFLKTSFYHLFLHAGTRRDKIQSFHIPVSLSFCLFQVLEQDIAGRQSSINAMNEKVKKFMETADPSTASTLQAKMSELAGRFSEASHKHKEKLIKIEELKTKVELFESLSEKLQSFLDEKNQALGETEAPRKDVSEVSQYMQEASVELAKRKKDLEVLQQLLEELSFHALPGDKALVLEKVNALSKKFREVEETVKEKEEDVSSCQKQMDTFELLVESLKKWIKETTERIPAAQPSLNTEELKKPLEDTLTLKDEWTLKAPELQKMNSRGTLLCNLITAVTSPAKLRAVAKSGMHLYNQVKLTAVQQAMSDVNHSYEDLGVLLKEKISELENMLSKMQNIQEESTSVMQWLQKMDKTASDWEAAPADSEAVKAQVEQHKLFETELKQSANKVQELKDKVTELLEKNPNSPEAPKWRQVLDKIGTSAKLFTSERQQKLEESSNYLTQFNTTEAQLKHWLVEKELMVSVLGPLSIDPNMLKTQKQQVQILLKEFDTRKPQYEQLTVAGEGILKRPGEHPPSHEIVKQQLAAVAQQWDSLTGQLRNRCDRIDQAIVKSTEYQSLLRSLSDKLSALDSKLSSSLAVSTQPDAVKQQLEIAREMKEEIEQEMKNINAARALCEELSALVGEEYLKAELTRQLDGILKSFKDLEQKSDNHVQQLQSAYAASHQFQQTSKDFQAWLGKKKEELNQARPVSAKLDALQSLIEEQKDFQKTMTDQISSYERIVAEGESILQKTQGADKAALQTQIATLRSNWDEMNKQVKERQEKLTDCLEKALKYKQHVENLQPWIEKCQSNVGELKVSINPVEIENSIVQVRAWQKDLDKHHGMVELLNNTAESLLNASQTDKEVVQEETKALNQKVNVVTEQLHKKRESLEIMAQRLKEFQESSRETEKQLKNAKEHLEAHNSLGPQSFSNKHLTMMQAQQKALQALKPHVDLAKKLAQDLVVEASDSAGVSDLLLQAESLEQEYTAVSRQVEDRCSFLETKLQGIGHFQNRIREMFSQFAEFDDELDSMAPVGRDLEVLQSQRKDIKCCLKKLEDLIMNNENANKNCKMMLATEAEDSPDLVGIKRDLEALNKQCNKLLDRAKAREDQVEGTISRVEEFYSKLKEFSSLLRRAEEHEESQGPVGMETETINQQLDTFKVFQKEEIEPLQVKQQEVNWLGQGLIQSAAKSTNTENLEHDLEDVNTRWKTLNKKVAQRAAQLQEALLHCGRFQDALESLLSWLIDTEDLVANQKPPSAEFKVVKAQIQEQKLLQRLLDDRKPTVEVIKREGEKIAESAEPADKVKILKQLSLLDSRWDALLTKAETRNRQLEGILVVAQQFHEALEPLVEWLTATEKRLANAEPIGTQASKLQQQISQHKALEDDVLAHNKSLQQAISTGQSLKSMSSREDKYMVQEKLDSSQARYIEIQEKSSSRSELLQQAYSNAQIFGEDEVELMNWLNEIHDKLSKLSVQDCNPELLEKQRSELLDLQEEILLRKQNVDLAIQNGLELLKQTTGDEVVIIQDKLEGIKARYRDITKLSSDVSKTLEQALQLAGQLHSTHEELCKWLDEVEVELECYETQIPKGEELSQVQERQKELKKEAKNNKGLLDTLNEVGSAFLELVPWRAREGLDKMITEDNERYRLVSDKISQKVDEIDAAILRSQQFDQAADAEFAWIAETEKQLMSLGDIMLEQDQTMAQLQVQKAFTMEILRHKDTIDELVKSGDKIMNTCTEEEKQTMKKKMKSLLQKYDAVCQMNSERYLQLERAQSLVNQFWETYEELWPWLTETEMIISQLPAPALEYETLKQQQEEHRQLRELIAEHKPHIDKMNKTGPQLLELSPGEGFSIQEKYVAADTLYSKIKEDVKKRALALDDAISQCTQFHDKIDSTLEILKRIVEHLRQPPSISAEVEKIKEQISENKNVSVDLEKLQPVYETLKQRGEEMIARSEGADKDISAKAVQDKLDQMVLIWKDIQTLTEKREAELLDVMELAAKFWYDHAALVATIKYIQDLIGQLEGPGIDPSVVKQQQEAAETVKEEIDGLQEELETVLNLGFELRGACGEPDKPIVNKSIDELNSAWDALNKTWKERVDKLIEAMQAAVQYQDGLQAIFDWVDIAGSKLASMSPVGTDLETVKQQTEELKQFKTEAYQQQIEMERLNHQAELLLKKVTEESDKHTVQDPLSELKLLWDSLEEKIINRQHKLEGALLALGQFQHALDELLTWLTHTEDLLNEQKPVGGDPKAIEIELAKHHVLQNDVLAHQSTVEAVKKAGNDLIESSAVEEASNLRSKLKLLNQRWKNVLEKTEQRKQQLDTLNLAMEFHNSLEDFGNWLTQAEQTLTAASQPSLILDTVLFQIDEHKVCKETDVETFNFNVVFGVIFSLFSKVFATEVNSHREQIIELDKTGTHLKYFSQKQDVVLIKNQLIIAQSRWEKVVQRLAERERALDDARKRAKKFHEAWHKLMEWLEESEKALDSDLEIANEPDKIKMQLAQHKEFQKSLGAKHSVYDNTNRTGRSLKTTLADDNLKLDNMLSELRDKWDTICGKSVERQNKLEEALLFSGQFTDALQALIDWLYKVEPQLAEDQPVHGDSDLVMNLIDNHKVFQKELGKRTSSVQALKRSARELIEGSRDDSSWVKVQMQELSTRWEKVCALSVSKQTRLEQALRQAEEFHSVVHVLLAWQAEAEQALRCHGVLPDDEEALLALIEQHREFMKKMEEKKAEVNKATSMGEAILAICHPDSITTIKNWITIIRARFEEVLVWAKQHQQRLAGALAGLIANQELLESLLSWLQWAETTLTEKDKEVIPQEIDEVKALIAEHQTFVEEMTRKQPDVDKFTKTYKRKAVEPTPVQSHIPVLDKGRAGRKRSPTPGIYLSAAPTQIETKNPRVNLLVSKWQQVWLLALERRRKLNDALDRLEELREFANFDFDIWRKKYMRWMNHKKSRVMDFFRRIDKDQDGKITRQEFIDGILSSKFPTSRLEMSAVADIFDRDGDGYIDYYEFVAALHPNKDAYKPLTDADKIEDEVTRQVAKCKCAKRFQVEQIGDNKYRTVVWFLLQFGDSQQLRLVRILRSTVMVRVGGGWMALDEFLVKNDPCRAKGRTNVELREKFILADGASQSMAAFRPRGRRSRPSSRGASPNRSTSLSSQAGQAAAPQAVGTPIQGSKLRMPGYLSGKGFHSGEDSGILSTAATRVRAQTPSRPGSRAGSKAGSRSSSRRGSDASDFDISEIQSVCSDMSETVPATSRPTPRAGSRPGSAKPSKIPTPQRRPLASCPGPRRASP